MCRPDGMLKLVMEAMPKIYANKYVSVVPKDTIVYPKDLRGQK